MQTRAARELVLREHLTSARAEVEAAQLAATLLAEREARATTARGAKLHELRKAIEIDLVAAAGGGDVDAARRVSRRRRALGAELRRAAR